MGNAWRIGIDDENPTELVTSGIFRLSRNPIFLGVRLNFVGLFLVLPNAVTLVIWLLGDAMLQIQVLLEEEYLRQAHGEAYQKYIQQVRRWL
jgi:protein-S-isoprenylcysteine O-methyltransferase Ste14